MTSDTLRVAPLRAALFSLLLALVAAPLAAAEAAPDSGAAAEAGADTFSDSAYRVVVAGEQAAAFAGQPLRALELTLTPMRRAEIDERLQSALGYLETVASEFAVVLVDLERTDDADAEAALRERARAVDAFKQDLVSRTNVLMQAADAKGADTSEARAYVSQVATLSAPQTASEADAATLADERARQAVRRIRERPAAHERDAPWDVAVAEVELELRSLQVPEVKDRVEQWMQLLEREVQERVRIDAALLGTENADERAALARLGSAQQARIRALVERTQVGVQILATRGAETKPYTDYIQTATGQSIDVTNPAVFWAQAKAWLTSADGGLSLLLNVVQFIAILAAFWIGARFVGGLVGSAVRRMPKTSSLLGDFLETGSRRIVFTIGLLVAFSTLGVNITPLAAAIGAAGLVVGLALQGTLSNFASGILILVYRPFDIGDVVDAGGVSGKVDAMTLVSTRILTFDNQLNWVPNNSVWNNVIKNATAMDTRRVDLVFGIPYAEDLAKVQTIIEEAVAAHPLVLAEPAPNIRVNTLGDNSVNFIVRPWSKTADYWTVYWELLRDIKERFDAAGVSIPFPQRDLHLTGPIEVTFADGSRGSATPDGGTRPA